MSTVRRLSLLPLILLLLTLGCSEEAAEKREGKPAVSGVITDFYEEKGQVLIDNEVDSGIESGPILISLHPNAELIIEGETVTVPLDATLVGEVLMYG
ncbi:MULTISPECIES: hypothetical protein [Paenibacillus]|uniref:hypothetical protein n=1 Tax=Paenibacillus TaxID=44249 RepID=UPI0003F93E0E|nr:MULTISPECIES: hypothetical protein [Paenibacillus]KGP83469.1 hypothetical protein P364_0107860 [Paenibacillus sp. MAEPY2]KGP86234.1 hypothetical protein P363_0118265 [Paenibacillus sp. MAEPY1]OZQ66896.1 hypothetical protein CA599_18160 [Paenibacillus taichungensis]HBU83703.1 hypothetical protein [Paenibacillus sp.]